MFAAGEFRALWLAQVLSIAGDQFARLALALLVYDRTRSPTLAAATLAISTAAQFTGGLTLGWAADRYPRRAVMICCDLACLALVLAMTVPGVPPAALAALLFAQGLAFEPFLAARMAVNREALGRDRFPLGNGITLATYQVAQLAGFAAAGLVIAAAGVRAALLADAATFAASAVIVRAGVRRRPAPGGPGPALPRIRAGARLVFSRPPARTAMLVMWLVAFAASAEGAAAPLGRSLGGGPRATGWLLAAMAAGAAAGPLAWTRLVTPALRTRLAAVAAGAACGTLTLFAFRPGLPAALAILAVSGLLTGYIATAGAVLFDAVPDEHRGQASGVTGAGMALGQGVMIVAAGAAAALAGPAPAIAGCGAAGAVLAVPLAVRWRRL